MSNLIHGVVFSLTTLEDFEDPSYARELLRELLALPLEFRPVKYGAFRAEHLIGELEPVVDLITNRIAGAGHGRAGSAVLASRQCEYQVQWDKVLDRPSFPFVSGQLLGEQPESLVQDFTRVAKNLVPVIRPAYGDIRSMRVEGWDTPFDLKIRLPNIPNISIYGPPYIELFGRERIESAPFKHVESIGSDHYWLEAAVSLLELVSETTRAAIREHLGDDAFMSGRKWRYKSGVAPDFGLWRKMH